MIRTQAVTGEVEKQVEKHSFDKSLSLSTQLARLHEDVQQTYPFIARIAIVLYEHNSDLLQTFAYSGDTHTALTHYHVKLSECRSLVNIYRDKKPRIINDMSIFEGGTHAHTQTLKSLGYQASFTLPICTKGKLKGFIFLNSFEKNVFRTELLTTFENIGKLAMKLVDDFQNSISFLVENIKEIENYDLGRMLHTERIARYCRLIGEAVATKFKLTDEFIEQLCFFAPLHDIGKLAIPDSILLKPATLTMQEYEIFKTHTTKGLYFLQQQFYQQSYGENHQLNIFKNIVLYHHEQVNGQGYPSGLCHSNIPIEALIVATADTFDALTCQLPYKPSWSNEKAYAELLSQSNSKLDHDCVMALLNNRSQIEGIQRRFPVDESSFFH